MDSHLEMTQVAKHYTPTEILFSHTRIARQLLQNKSPKRKQQTR